MKNILYKKTTLVILVAVLALATAVFYKPVAKTVQKIYEDKFFGGIHLVRKGPSHGYFIEDVSGEEACAKRGGRFFMHGVGTTCEKPAPDAGKTCRFDEECAKNCLYNDKNVTAGACEKYAGDESGWNVCHRPVDKGSRPPKGEVVCDFWLD